MRLKKIMLVIVCLLMLSMVNAQIKGVTETGDEVLLSADGTWKYVEEIKNNESITTNPTNFLKPADAAFLLKSKIADVGIWLNSKKWNFEKSTDNTTEYTFSLKENSAVGAFIVVEPLGMEMKSLRKFAIENVQNASSLFKLAHEEYRYVNGLKMLKLEFNATVDGIQLVYYNYYFSDSTATVQFLSYMPKNLAAKYIKEEEALLNGLVLLNANSKSDAERQSKTNIQSTFVPGSNCKATFIGSWTYTANGKKFIDKIEGSKIFETNYSDLFSSEYKITWVDDCSYELVLLKSNDPSAKLIKTGSVIAVDILEMDENQMRFQLTYAGKTISGVMQKIS